VGGPTKALAAAVLLAWTVAPVAAVEPIVIGAINPLSGPFGVQGSALHEGAVLAIDQANARGGVRGRPLRLVGRDDEGKPQRAVAAAEELVGLTGAVGLTGGYLDSLVGPISDVAERSWVPYVAAASLDRRLTARGHQYFFRVSSLKPYVEVTTGIVRDVFKAGNVAIFYSTTPGATQLARAQRQVFEQWGIRVSVFEPFAPGLSDFTALLTRIRAAGAEILLSDTFFADHLLLIRQMTPLGISLNAFIGAFGMEFPDVIRELGPASEGLYGTTSWQPGLAAGPREAESKAFVEAFVKRFGREPPPLTMHGYAAARALVGALETLAPGPISGERVREALARIHVDTPMGRVKFDGHGEPVEYERVVVQIQGGRHVVVYPPTRATAAPRFPIR